MTDDRIDRALRMASKIKDASNLLVGHFTMYKYSAGDVAASLGFIMNRCLRAMDTDEEREAFIMDIVRLAVADVDELAEKYKEDVAEMEEREKWHS